MNQIETILAQIGNRKDPRTGAVEAPIYLSTAYQHPTLGQSTGYDYTRTANPTREIVEEAIASLEKGVQGFACSSGMAAIQLVFSLFKHGDEILVTEDIYGGSYRLFQHLQQSYQVTPVYVSPENVERHITPNTKAIFIETPTNPLLMEIDIQYIAAIAKKHDALLIVDNTFYTPYLQQPLTEGADIVIHSATKYLGGHNDVLAGLVAVKDHELGEQLFYLHNAIGAVLSPLDSMLLIRGMKTLTLRLERQQQNAQILAAFLREHDKVRDVLYPGKGAMISFRVTDNSLIAPFLEQLKVISFAESLGGVESFITYPTTQTHADIPKDELERRGISDTLLRFSVGIENIEDLKSDLDQALGGK
ncbi:methionine biosynthesis PLP-dependent protein [Gracilibacillus caseinilyticus]|uniref:Methionine biosynthesis PLP-dependent protein n=1 Tax=Gracilibacillus caseinilyticus TaxID=2932256 RepID=A0ABY4ERL5_9BACI|nr:methionine biosynthesis PLP-dependent protein [Gracilibacillus caseinilyticus]UOQ47076.1 methionine biosynthesis PLP-dependent protein [Gracilibacillus caseinilyticus]